MSDSNLEKILMLDDNSDYRKLIKTFINKLLPGVEVIEYDPVFEGIPGDDFDWSEIDVLLLDYHLSIVGTTGLDILHKNHKKDSFPATIMLTGAGTEEIAISALDLGIYEYQPKQSLTKDKLKQSIINAWEEKKTARVKQKEATQYNKSFSKEVFYENLEQAYARKGIERALVIIKPDEIDTLEDEIGIIGRDNLINHIAKNSFEIFKIGACNPNITRVSDTEIGIQIDYPINEETLDFNMQGLSKNLEKCTFKFSDEKYKFSVSIGILKLGTFNLSAEELIQIASTACQHASKVEGNSHYVWKETDVIPKSIGNIDEHQSNNQIAPVVTDGEKEKLELELKAAAAAKQNAEKAVQAEQESKKALEEKLKIAEQAKVKAEAELQLAAEVKAKAEVQAKLLAEEEAKIQAETEKRMQAGQKAKAEAEKEANSRAQAELRAEQEAKHRLEAELKAEQEAKQRLEAELKAEAEAKAKAQAELKAEEEAEAKAQAELRAEQEAKHRLEAELKAEAEAKAKAQAELKAEEEAEAKAQAELRAEQEAKQRLEVELKAETEAKAKAQAELKAEEEAEAKAQAELRAITEEEARLEAEKRAEQETSAKLQAEAEMKAAKEEKEKLEAELRFFAEAKEKAEAEMKSAKEEKEKLEAQLKAFTEAKEKAETEQKEKINEEEIKESKIVVDAEVESMPTQTDPDASQEENEESGKTDRSLEEVESQIRKLIDEKRIIQTYQPVTAMFADEDETNDIYKTGLQAISESEEFNQHLSDTSVFSISLQQIINEWILRQVFLRITESGTTKCEYMFLITVTESWFSDIALFQWLQKILSQTKKYNPGKSIILDVPLDTFNKHRKRAEALINTLRKSHQFTIALSKIDTVDDISEHCSITSSSLLLVNIDQLNKLTATLAPNTKPEVENEGDDEEEKRNLLQHLKSKNIRIITSGIEDSTLLTDAITAGTDYTLGDFVGEIQENLVESSTVESFELT